MLFQIKRKMKNCIFSGLISTFLILVMTNNVKAASEEVQPAADFTLKSRSNGNIRLAELRGNIVLVNFWASWCGPCRKEMPVLEKIHQEYKDLGFTVLAVNIDENSDKANKLLRDIDVSFPIVYDTNGKVSELYDVNAMPSTFFIDRNGDMRLVHAGYKTGDEIKYRKIVKALIRE